MVVLFHRGCLHVVKFKKENHVPRGLPFPPLKVRRQQLHIHSWPCYRVCAEQENTTWLGSGVQNNTRAMVARTGVQLPLE